MRTAGRRITLLGFLLLSICFFLPQIKSCSTPFVPAREVMNNGASALLTLLMPFVFGFVGLVVYAIVNLTRRVKVERILAIVWCVLCILMLLPSAVLLGEQYVRSASASRPPDEPLWMWSIFVFGSLILLIATAFVLKRRFRFRPLCTLYCGLTALAFFLSWIIQAAVHGSWGDLYYGIWLSATSCVLICAGAVLELFAPPPQPPPSVEL